MKWSAGALRCCRLRGKNWSVGGGASNSEEVLKQAEELHPDVILRDVSVPSIAGLEIDNASADAGELSDTKVLIVSQHDPHHPYVTVEVR